MPPFTFFRYLTVYCTYVSHHLWRHPVRDGRPRGRGPLRVDGVDVEAHVDGEGEAGADLAVQVLGGNDAFFEKKNHSFYFKLQNSP